MVDSDKSRRLKETQLEILLAFDKACRDLGLSYFLDSGTLLGAARHQGYIPWDDDIDVGMVREDYDMFLAKGQQYLGDRYFLQSKVSDPSAPFLFTKVRKNGTRMTEVSVAHHSMHQGIWIDVFPYDCIRATHSSIRSKMIRREMIYKLYRRRVRSKPSFDRPRLRSALRILTWRLAQLVDDDFCQRHIDGLRDRRVDTTAGYYTCLAYSVDFPLLRHSDVFPLTSLKFEGRDFPVINNWRKYLQQVYGNWKVLPPVEQRTSHTTSDIEF